MTHADDFTDKRLGAHQKKSNAHQIKSKKISQKDLE